MANKKTQKRKMKVEEIDWENIKENDILEEVNVEIDPNALDGPFTCFECGTKTKKVKKKGKHKGINFTYTVWECLKCKETYIDWFEPSKLQIIIGINNALNGKAIRMERSLNYDGKTFFFRFPKDLTNGWNKDEKVTINVVTPKTFLIEVKKEAKT